MLNYPQTSLKNSCGRWVCQKKIFNTSTGSWRITWTNKTSSIRWADGDGKTPSWLCKIARCWRFTTSATIRPSSIWGRSSASASPIAIRFIPAPQDCWPKSKSCPTVRSCWKTRQQRWLLTSRSNLSNARSRTKKRTTQKKNATRSRPSSWSAHWRWLSSRWRWAKADNTIFQSLKTIACYYIPMRACWRIQATKACTNTIRTQPFRSKRKKANLFPQRTKLIIRRYQSNVFSLSTWTDAARFSGLSKRFTRASTKTTHWHGV